MKVVCATRGDSIAKYHNREAPARCAKAAVEIHGSYGLSDEVPVERLYRDCMAPIIYGGTPTSTSSSWAGWNWESTRCRDKDW